MLAQSIRRLVPPETRTAVMRRDEDWCLIEFVPTGRVRRRTVTIGERTYDHDVPEVRAQVLGAANTLDVLADTYALPEPAMSDEWAERSAEWARLEKLVADRDALIVRVVAPMLVERLRRAADQMPESDPSAWRVCGNCAGTEGATVPAGGNAADGRASWTCPVCRGSARVPASPEVLFVGPDGQCAVRADVAAWLRENMATVTVDVSSGFQHCDVTVRLHGSRLLREVNRKVASGQRTWTRRGSVFSHVSFDTSVSVRLMLRPSDATASADPENPGGTSAQHAPLEYARDRTYDPTGEQDVLTWLPAEQVGDALPTGEEWLDMLQRSLAARFLSWSLNDAQPDDGTGVHLSVRRIPVVAQMPADTLLDDMGAAVRGTGFALGFSYGVIATGQFGPQVLLMRTDGTVVTEIGLGWDWRTALAEAHDRLPGILARMGR